MKSHAKDRLDVAIAALRYLLDDESLDVSDRYLAANLIRGAAQEYERNLYAELLKQLKE